MIIWYFMLSGGQLLGVGIAAMEAHEGIIVRIVKFTLMDSSVHIIGNGIVNI